MSSQNRKSPNPTNSISSSDNTEDNTVKPSSIPRLSPPQMPLPPTPKPKQKAKPFNVLLNEIFDSITTPIDIESINATKEATLHWDKDLVDGAMKNLTKSQPNAMQGIVLLDEAQTNSFVAKQYISYALQQRLRQQSQAPAGNSASNAGEKRIGTIISVSDLFLISSILDASINSWAMATPKTNNTIFGSTGSNSSSDNEENITMSIFTRSIQGVCTGLVNCLNKLVVITKNKPIILSLDLSSVQSQELFINTIESLLIKYPAYFEFYNDNMEDCKKNSFKGWKAVESVILRKILQSLGLKYIVFFKDTRETGGEQDDLYGLENFNLQATLNKSTGDGSVGNGSEGDVETEEEDDDVAFLEQYLKTKAKTPACILRGIIKENIKETRYQLFKCSTYDLCAEELIPNESEISDIKKLTDEQIETAKRVFDSLIIDRHFTPSQSASNSTRATTADNSDDETEVDSKVDLTLASPMHIDTPNYGHGNVNTDPSYCSIPTIDTINCNNGGIVTPPTTSISRNYKGIMLYESSSKSLESIIYWMMLYNATIPEDERYHIILVSSQDLIYNIGDDQELRGLRARVDNHYNYIIDIIQKSIKSSPRCDKVLLIIDSLDQLLEMSKLNQDRFFSLSILKAMDIDNTEGVKDYEKNISSVFETSKLVLEKLAATSTLNDGNVEILSIVPMYISKMVNTKAEMKETVASLFKSRVQLFKELYIDGEEDFKKMFNPTLENYDDIEIPSGIKDVSELKEQDTNKDSENATNSSDNSGSEGSKNFSTMTNQSDEDADEGGLDAGDKQIIKKLFSLLKEGDVDIIIESGSDSEMDANPLHDNDIGSSSDDSSNES
ncbi:hypothetical protein H4219_004767 [Mycoemilia scoparia]|uniref:Uncharacterized protein n=1 Tax=Mycoemilia scoparia TaxID=417184 RepID=A0A9W7ZX66_9FUNG|nr:hypothetical protein H4219_004767 [Mycoemilia scoparia]